MNARALIGAALDCGAAGAALIEQSQIVLSAAFRDICRSNACGNYGRCWMCPPDLGDIGELMARVRAYSRGLLYRTVSGIEDSFDIEGMTAAAAAHAGVSRRIARALAPLFGGGLLHLTCGGCHLCARCARRDDLPCRFPKRALGSLEGYGVDVYNTAKATGLPYNSGANTVTFFGLVLFSEE